MRAFHYPGPDIPSEELLPSGEVVSLRAERLRKKAFGFLEGGFEPVGIGVEKNPTAPGWEKGEITLDRLWDGVLISNEHTGIGFRAGTGANPISAVDNDILEPELNEEVSGLIRRHLGATAERVGRPPKRLHAYRCEPHRKITVKGYVPRTGDPSKPETKEERKARKRQVEFLGTGQQFVAFGIHPDTRRPYEWSYPGSGNPGNPADLWPTPNPPASVEMLAQTTPAEIRKAANKIAALFKRWGLEDVKITGDTERAAGTASPFEGTPVTQEQLRAMLAVIPRNAPREEWLRIVAALTTAPVALEDGTPEPAYNGLALLLEFADPAYHGDVRDLWRSTVDNPRTDLPDIRALYNLAHEYGYRGPASIIGGRHSVQEAFSDIIKGRPAEALLEDGEETIEIADFSHDGLALGLGHEMAQLGRYVALWGKWLLWDGSRWLTDEKLTVLSMTREYLRTRARHFANKPPAELNPAAVRKVVKELRSNGTVTAVSSFLRSNHELATTPDDWDCDAHLLGTPGGTVNLRTGELRPARQSDFITRRTAVAPASPGTEAPLWQKFLERIFCHDPELIPFVQRAVGYSLLGSVSEHVLLFCWGQGQNGKGVFLNTLTRLLGDYAKTLPPEMLMASRGERHPTDVAGLLGARMAVAQEVKKGSAWDEQKIKALTGGDQITARFMRQDFFSFEPQFTLWVAGNNRPTFRGVDKAISRRILLVPFAQSIPDAEKDIALPTKLGAEWPAILRWAVDGFREWQDRGLEPPASVLGATKDYLGAEDLLGLWLDECCMIEPEAKALLKDLYDSWRWWAHAQNIGPLSVGSRISFGKLLDERGFTRLGKGKQGQAFGGLRLNGNQPEPAAGEELPE